MIRLYSKNMNIKRLTPCLPFDSKTHLADLDHHLHESLVSGSKFSNTATINQRPPESLLVVHGEVIPSNAWICKYY